MAIDSAAKRFSMMRFGSGTRVVYPTGSVNAAARLDFLGLYRGIAAAEAAVATFFTRIAASAEALNISPATERLIISVTEN